MLSIASGASDSGAIKALYDLRHILIVYVYVPEALTALAIAPSSVASAVRARWYGWLSALVGLILVSGAADLARTGCLGRIRTGDISLAGRAQGALFVRREVVAPAGFEPAISALRGLRPSPLDDGATRLVGGVGVEPTTSRV